MINIRKLVTFFLFFIYHTPFFFYILFAVQSFFNTFPSLQVHGQSNLVELKLGSLLPLSVDDKAIQSYLYDIWNGITMAVKELEQEAADSGVRFTFINYDYNNGSLHTTRPELSLDGNALVLNATLDLAQLPVVGLVGPLARHFHRSMADISNIYKIPLCNHGSSLPVFSNRKLYPYLFNTYPSLMNYVTAFLKLLKQFHWNRFLILFSQEPFGIALANALKTKTLDQPQLDMTLIPFWENGPLSQLNTSIDLALKSKYRIFLISSMGEARTAILKTLFHRKIFSQYNVTFVFIDHISLVLNSTASSTELDSFYSKQSPLRGSFIISIIKELSKTPGYDVFKKKLATYSSDADAMHSINTYTCAVSLMRGLIKLRNNPTSRPWDVHRFLDTAPDHILGRLEYDADATLPSGAEIFNWQSQGPKLIATVNSAGKLSKVKPTMFLRGASSPPSDSPEITDIYVKFTSIPGIIVISMSGAMALLLFLSILIFLACYSHEELQPYTPLYALWMSIGSLFYLGCILMQFFLTQWYGCHVALLIGTLGAGNAIGPLIAKTYLIVRVFQHPFYQTFNARPSSSSSSSSKPPRFQSALSIYSSNRSSCFPSKPTQLAWIIVFLDLILALLYIFVTPMKGTLVNIGSSSQTYICIPLIHSDTSGSSETQIFVSGNPLFYILALFHAFLMIWIMWMSWESPQTDTKSTQSIRLISIMAYQYSLVGVLIFLTWALDQYLYPISFWVRIAALFLTVSLQFFLFALPPLLALYKRLRHSGRLSIMSLPSSNLDLPMTSEPTLSTSASNEYEGSLIYTEKSLSWSWGTLFKWSKKETWKWSRIKVLPQSNWVIILDPEFCVKYHKVIFKPNPGELGVARLLPQSSSSTVPYPSKHIFYILTKDKVYAFWAQREEEAKKWVKVFQKTP